MNPPELNEAQLGVLRQLADMFGYKLTKDRIRWFDVALGDLPVENVMVALNRAALTCKFFPKPAELRELAGAVTGQLSLDEFATLAWNTVAKAISSVGYDRSVSFQDLVINATIRQLGGWNKIVNTPATELKWLKNDFIKTYTAMSKLQLSAQQTARLAGYVELTNIANGFGQHPVPVAYVPHVTDVRSGKVLLAMSGSAEPKRLEGDATRKLEDIRNMTAKRLSFDTHEEPVALPIDKGDQLKLLASFKPRYTPATVNVSSPELDSYKLDTDSLEREAKDAEFDDYKTNDEEQKELRRIEKRPVQSA